MLRGLSLTERTIILPVGGLRSGVPANYGSGLEKAFQEVSCNHGGLVTGHLLFPL